MRGDDRGERGSAQDDNFLHPKTRPIEFVKNRSHSFTLGGMKGGEDIAARNRLQSSSGNVLPNRTKFNVGVKRCGARVRSLRSGRVQFLADRDHGVGSDKPSAAVETTRHVLHVGVTSFAELSVCVLCFCSELVDLRKADRHEFEGGSYNPRGMPRQLFNLGKVSRPKEIAVFSKDVCTVAYTGIVDFTTIRCGEPTFERTRDSRGSIECRGAARATPRLD